MVPAFLLAMFACIIGSPAILGVWLVRLWHGTLEKNADIAHPTGIAVGLALVIAVSLLAAVSTEAQREVGPWIVYLGVLNAITFGVGIGVGLLEQRDKPKR